MFRRFILGTRGSALALWQAHHVAGLLQSAGVDVELSIIKTEGDLQQAEPLGAGDVGVFVRRIEEALDAREIDLAVHSMKDLPTTQPEGLTIAAVPLRHDPRDAILTVAGEDLDGLRAGAVVGTGSPRRRMQLLRARPDLRVVGLRGNVDTRIRRLVEGRHDAIVLALAGVERLGIREVRIRPIPVERCLPAVGQGALAIETRADDAEVRGLLSPLNHAPSELAVQAERACLRRLGGGCLAPATAYARQDGGELVISAVVGDLEGRRLIEETVRCSAAAAEASAVQLAERLLAEGAGALLEQARRAH